MTTIRKEFWQKTRREVGAADLPDSVVESVLKTHEQAVKQAVAEGKPVPTEVLKDYPELRKGIDKPIKSDIMTSEGKGNDNGNEVQSSRIRSQGAQLPQGKQEVRHQGNEPSRSAEVGEGEGSGSEAVRRESNEGGRAGLHSVESGNPPEDSGERKRLTPSKDIVLTSASEIGHNAGAVTKFEANLDAIRTLKRIEDENRPPTSEEQAKLARYSGFGDSAFGEAFPRNEYGNFKNTPWGRRREELKALTTDEEFQAIEKSRLNAFYTTPEVISSMWKALDKMGVDNLKNPRILEPSAGSGRFLGYQPKQLTDKSQRIAVELDSLTGRMLKQMYPETTVYAGIGFEKAPIPKDSIDVAVSNVPFGNYPIFDPTFKKDRKKLTRSIHNYFFAKTLEELRPGGVLAFITSHQTLDAPTSKPVRQALAEQADFVGAIRLPNNAFPDTQVVTDIIFMKKRIPGEAKGDQSWIDTTKQPFHVKSSYDDGFDTEIEVNKYFVDNPDMVLGVPSGNGSMNPHRYSEGEYTVEPPKVALSTLLDKAVDRMPQNIMVDTPRRELPKRVYTGIKDVREGSRVVGDDGNVYVQHGGVQETANLTATEEAKVKGMIGIRDAAKAVVNNQVRNGSNESLAIAQDTLKMKYKDYVLANGPLTASKNTDLLEGDPDMPFLKALENNAVLRKGKNELTEDDKRLVKVLNGSLPVEDRDFDKIQMPIFNKRIIHGLGEKPVTTFADAESVVKNEVGRLDFRIMAEKLGKTEDEVIKGLADQKLIYNNPMTGEWEPADQYLTGDVRNKLRQAEAAADARPHEYKANVEALKIIQPAEIQAGQISARMGAPWIPASDINDFTQDLLSARENWRRRDRAEYYKYNEITGEWQLIYKPDVSRYSTASEEYGTTRMTPTQIITRILNGKVVEVNDKITDPDGKERSVRNPQETIAAQEKAKLIQQKFQEWIWKDADRTERLVKDYNDKFNNYRPRTFDGAHQELPGIAEKWNKQLHSHQKDAIWRVVQDRTALLAHEVGFGKTAVMVVSGMELRRLGLSRKNLYVVPKATHAQFRDQFLDIYPFAKILYPGEDDFTPEKRAEFMSRAITGDWDAIIVADSQFRKIPVKPETEQRFLNEEIATIREALETTDDKKTQKEIQKSLERSLVRMEIVQNKLKEKNDKTVYFEDIGIDQMYVDEADMFKNLKFVTKMGRIKGLPNSESDRAWDMYQKSRTLQEDKHNGVVFATGTPVANTIAEMYTMMRYLQEPMLEEKGLKHFDGWAKTFGETTESLEQTPTGQYKLTQRFAKFANAPELSNMWQTVADIRVADEVPEMVRQRPRIVDDQGKARRTVVAVQPDEQLLAYMKSLEKRADELKNKDPHEDNMLKIASDARKASLDMRLVEAGATVNPRGKIAVASNKIAEIYRDTMKDKGAQLVFLDLGTPKAKEKEIEPGVIEEDDDTGDEQRLLKDVYGSLKAQLVADGIPEREVAFIHDAKNDKQKQAILERVNKGDIRVLIGSTQKLGTGVNAQERAAALHHMDAPWRPRDIEQREGRIVRQGNLIYGPKKDENGKIIDSGKGVKVFTYVTERSFDAYMWQAIEAKSKAIKSIMRRSVPPRVIEDIDSFTMSASEAKAIASGNPDVLKAVTLKNSVTRLQMLRASHTDSKIRANAQLKSIPSQITSLNESIGKMEKDSKLVKEDAKFAMNVKGNRYTERPDAGEALYKAIKDAKDGEDVAEYQGFKIKILDQGPQSGYKLVVYNPETKNDYATSNIMYADLTPTGAVTRVDNKVKSIANELVKAREQLKEHETNLRTYKTQSETAFDREEQLARMEAELSRLERKLQGEEVEEAPSDNYAVEEEPPEVEPVYHYSAREEEQKAKAEIQAVKAEVEPVEKTLEVKPPEAKIEAVIEKMAPVEGKQPPTMTKETVKTLEPTVKTAVIETMNEGITKLPDVIKSVREKTNSTLSDHELMQAVIRTTPDIAEEQVKVETPKVEARQSEMSPRQEIASKATDVELEKQLVMDKAHLESETNPSIKAYHQRNIDVVESEIAKRTSQPTPELKAEAKISIGGTRLKTYNRRQKLTRKIKPTQGREAVTRRPHKAEKVGSTPTPATIPSKEELQRIQDARTQRAQSMDNSRQHHVVVSSNNPSVRTWIRRPGTMDIRGIDTLSIKRKNKDIAIRKSKLPPKSSERNLGYGIVESRTKYGRRRHLRLT